MRYVAYDGNGTVMLVAANGYDARAKGAERLVELEKRLVLSLPSGHRIQYAPWKRSARAPNPFAFGTGHGDRGDSGRDGTGCHPRSP